MAQRLQRHERCPGSGFIDQGMRQLPLPRKERIMRLGWSVRRAVTIGLGVMMILGIGAVASHAACACVNGECYTDVIVSGAGWELANGRYIFAGHFPELGLCVFTDTGEFGFGEGKFNRAVGYDSGTWVIVDVHHLEGLLYLHDGGSDVPPPPSGGWEPFHPDLLPAPIVTGGQPCSQTPPPPPLQISPAGVCGSYLDRCLDLPEGEAPPMVGLCPLAAVYEVGEVVTGACSICDAAGSVMRGSYVHLYIYTVDIEPRPETRTLLDHWTVHYDRDAGGYTYSWDTTDIAPGYCDLYLSFADGSSHTCRIELTAPVE